MGTPWYVLARQYYIDTCLPFGLRSVPSIFHNFASAIHWVLENDYGAILLHYLDDFLLVGSPDQPTCQESMSTMLQVCEAMGIPVATEKCEGPVTCITFLGIVLDSSLQQLRLPPKKLQDEHLIPDQIMAWQTQSYQKGAPISHRETILCSQGSPSRPPVPASSHPALNNSEEATPPHPPQPRSQSRPMMVEQLPTILEWHLDVHSTRVEGCRLLPAVH